MFYKVMTPVGHIIVRSICKNPNSLGLCQCYKYFEPYKKISLEQMMHYQKCKLGPLTQDGDMTNKCIKSLRAVPSKKTSVN